MVLLQAKATIMGEAKGFMILIHEIPATQGTEINS